MLHTTVVLPVLFALQAVGGGGTDPISAQIDRAAKAYDQGDCQEVLAAFLALPDPEHDLALDGLSQYRWGFCAGLLRQGDPGPHFRAAADILADELKSPNPRLEAFFYRTNALLNLKRQDEAAATARAAIERWTAGKLTVPADDAGAWFQLGKLFVDGGDAKGAAPHFRRALDAAAAAHKPLRQAYVERIADFALAQRDSVLARKAADALSTADPNSLPAMERSGRLLVALGDYTAARDRLRQALRVPGEAAVDVQYMAAALDRVLEVSQWGEKPRETLPEGRPVSGLTDEELKAALRDCAKAFQDVNGPVVEVPRPTGAGTRPAPHPEVAARLHEIQTRFAGLLVEAMRRQASLQEWSVPDGYAMLIHTPWANAFIQKVDKDRASQLIDQVRKR